MFPLIDNTAKEFLIRLKKRCNENLPVDRKKGIEPSDCKDKTDNTSNKYAVIDAEKVVGGFTADAIVPCAFGLKSSVMDNEKDPFAEALHAFYEMSLYNIFEK
jgi:hypothetical protein